MSASFIISLMTGQLSAMRHGYSGDMRIIETYFVFVNGQMEEKNRNFTPQKSSYNEIFEELFSVMIARCLSLSSS